MATTLLSPIKLGSLELANRVVMAPLTRGRAGLSKNLRVPTSIMGDYYEQRASAGLIIAEATAVSDQGFGNYGAPGCYTPEHAAGWKPIVNRVHAKGGKIFLQLWHMGRQAHSSFHEVKEIVSASAIGLSEAHKITNSSFERVNYEVPRALTTEEVPLVVADYKHSAATAKEAGFDGVEIHAANGYLIDQFLQSVSNKRTDKYGGSFENRFRFLKEIVEAILEVYPADRIGVRISPNGVFGEVGSEDNELLFPYVASQLRPYGLAYLHVMDGLGFGWHGKGKVVTLHDIKKQFEGPVIGNIGYTKETADGAIRSGAADLIAFGRPFIGNPDLVERFANNWPLVDAPYTSYYGDNGEQDGTTGKGYSDFPSYSKKVEA